MIERQEEDQETETLWSINQRRRAMYLKTLRETYARVILTDDAHALIGTKPLEKGCDGADCDCSRMPHQVIDGVTYADVTREIVCLDSDPFQDEGPYSLRANDPVDLIALVSGVLEIEPGWGHDEHFVAKYAADFVAHVAECRRAMRVDTKRRAYYVPLIVHSRPSKPKAERAKKTKRGKRR